DQILVTSDHLDGFGVVRDRNNCEYSVGMEAPNSPGDCRHRSLLGLYLVGRNRIVRQINTLGGIQGKTGNANEIVGQPPLHKPFLDSAGRAPCRTGLLLDEFEGSSAFALKGVGEHRDEIKLLELALDNHELLFVPYMEPQRLPYGVCVCASER